MKPLLKKPSAWVPLLMSTAALVLVLGYAMIFGVQESRADEGTAAHLWQLFMGGQLPIIAYFAIRYLPVRPKESLCILLLQLFSGLMACAPIYYSEH